MSQLPSNVGIMLCTHTAAKTTGALLFLLYLVLPMLLSMLLSITVLSQKAEELAGVRESNHDPRILVDTENIHFTLPMQNGFKSFSIKSVT